ncbi:Hypothetical_protein [Hexamita inflata]|uniref:Hypothetical_protein n=1 Tax=Hexamita inflata TaxID=28002 RepID=A0AA86TWN5_9EUKA|nr:Hypothetical protein HINF_LOCUS11748 [Hexamita inflata]
MKPIRLAVIIESSAYTAILQQSTQKNSKQLIDKVQTFSLMVKNYKRSLAFYKATYAYIEGRVIIHDLVCVKQFFFQFFLFELPKIFLQEDKADTKSQPLVTYCEFRKKQLNQTNDLSFYFNFQQHQFNLQFGHFSAQNLQVSSRYLPIIKDQPN